MTLDDALSRLGFHASNVNCSNLEPSQNSHDCTYQVEGMAGLVGYASSDEEDEVVEQPQLQVSLRLELLYVVINSLTS